MTGRCWWPNLPDLKARQQGIVTVQIASGADCVVARQRAKQVAALLGFGNQDQTRIATAVSEIARNAFEYAGGGRVSYLLEAGAAPEMWAVISDGGRGIAQLDDIWSGSYKSASGLGLGLLGAKRLVDDFEIESSTKGTTVRLGKRLPIAAIGQVPAMREIVDRLSNLQGLDARLQLRHENQELLEVLEALRIRETELERLNAELEETNRGVLALYAELEDKADSLRDASEAKSRFLSVVSHELRTPLNSIASLSRLLLDRTDGELTAEQEKQIQFMLRSAHGLSEMVTDLLDLAKIEAGKTEVKQSEFTVGDVFAALRGMFRPLAVNDRVSLNFREEMSQAVLRTDEGKLAQILRNLISNALKFTAAGSVTVSAALNEGEGVTFSVADTGIGIAPEYRETVFEEWGQVASAQRSTHKGSGLGLPLSKKLAELLGGSLRFTSVVGEGSTFSVSLPGAVGGVSQARVQAGPESRVILIADDDEVARYVLTKQLRPLTTARILEAGDGVEALSMVTQERPQLLFLDLSMPRLGGEGVLRQLRSDVATAELPVVLITSQTLDLKQEQFLRAQVIDILQKQQEPGEEQRVRLERVLLTAGLSHNAG